MTPLSGRLRSLISELKRRRVFRVASFYVVAAWAAIQGATTVFPVLRLPESLTTVVVVAAIVGFPIALVLAWAFDLTAQGLEKTADADEPPGRLIRLPWLRPALALGFVGIFAAAGYAYWTRLDGPAARRTSVTMAAFPFAVSGGPSLEYLGEGIVTLLSTSLNGAGRIHSVEPDDVLAAVGNMEQVDAAAAQRLGRQLGADLVIAGAITEVGGKVRITAQLLDLRGRDRSYPIIISGNKDELLTLVDDLASAVLSEYYGGEGLELSKTAALTTASQPALRAYLAGEAEYRSARWDQAIASLREAVNADSTFALAHYRLATAAEWGAQFPLAQEAAARAYHYRDRLSDHDRELVEAFYAWSHGDAVTAERLYRQIVAEHPGNAEALYRLGEVLHHYNPLRGRSFREAREPFERALAGLPQEQSVRFHLMEIALYRRAHSAFDSMLVDAGLKGESMLRRQALRTFATGDAPAQDAVFADLETAHEGTVFAVATGAAQYTRNLDAAVRAARLMTAQRRPVPARATGHMLLAQLALARGRLAAADAELDSLAALHGPTALVHRALFTSLPFMQFDDQEVRRTRESLEVWDAAAAADFVAPGAFLGIHNGAFPALRLYSLALLSIRLNDLPAAERYAAELQASAQPALADLSRSLTMQIALTRGERVADVAEPAMYASVDQVANSAFYSRSLDRFLQGERLMALGEPRRAAAWYTAAMEGRNEFYLLGPAYLRLAQANETMGDTARAAQYYEAFTGLWSGADQRLQPLVRDARSQLQRLRPDARTQ